jgi:hypothetical protein
MSATVDPDGAHPGLSRVAILVGQIGRKIEGISRIEQVDLAVDRKLKLTFHDIADLFALVLKHPGRMPAWLDDHHACGMLTSALTPSLPEPDACPITARSARWWVGKYHNRALEAHFVETN